MRQQYLIMSKVPSDEVFAAAYNMDVAIVANDELYRKIVSICPFSDLQIAVSKRIPVIFKGIVVNLNILADLRSIERINRLKGKNSDKKSAEKILCKNLSSIMSSYKIPFSKHSSLKGYYSDICSAARSGLQMVIKNLVSVKNLESYNLFAMNELYNPKSGFYLSSLVGIYPDISRFIELLPKTVHEILLTKLDVLALDNNYIQFKELIETLFYSYDITGIDTGCIDKIVSVKKDNFLEYAVSLGLKVFEEISVEDLL